MAQSVVVRLEKLIPGAATERAYPEFGKHFDALDSAAEEMGTLSPFDFVSETPDEYAVMMKDVKEVEKELDAFNIDEIKDNPEFKQLLEAVQDDPDMLKLIQEAKTPDELVAQVFPETSPGEEWYEASEGVEFLNRLSEYVQVNPQKFKKLAQLRQELEDMTQVLEAAQREGVKFYFALQD